MRYAAIAALLVVACATTDNGELPEGRASYKTHPDFETIRPTAIALMKVKARSRDVAVGLRRAIYDGLFERNYSCLRLQAVDQNTAADGTLDRRKIAWDAIFTVEITDWRPYRGGRYYAASGTARMVHRQGETLWERTFTDNVFEAIVRAGTSDVSGTIEALADMIVKRLPAHPNVPPPE